MVKQFGPGSLCSCRLLVAGALFCVAASGGVVSDAEAGAPAAGPGPAAPATQPAAQPVGASSGPEQAVVRPGASPETRPDAQARLAAMVDKMPGVKVDVKNKRVEVDAVVVTPDAKWLELLACTKGTREYEAIIAVDARPSHIHLALILIGLESGAPMKWESIDAQPVKVTPARGAAVRVTLQYEKDGKPMSVPASQWVIDQTTNKPIAGETWVFAGSRVGWENNQPIYYADASGSVITLVNFGDDLLARDGLLGNKDGNDHFVVNAELVPAKGTKVTIVLEPVGEGTATTQPAATQPAGTPVDAR